MTRRWRRFWQGVFCLIPPLMLACGGKVETVDAVSKQEYCKALQSQATMTPPQASKWQDLDCLSFVSAPEPTPVTLHSCSVGRCMTCYVYSESVECVKG